MVVFKRWSCYFAQMLLKWQFMHQEADFFSQLPNCFDKDNWKILKLDGTTVFYLPVDEFGFSL
jgi:hypothetical protein